MQYIYYLIDPRDGLPKTAYKLVELGDMDPGQTFRFQAGINSSNVYMVIDAYDLGDVDLDKIYYVLLGSGKVYNSPPEKEVVQVQAELSYEDCA